jgi:hypothetical protein
MGGQPRSVRFFVISINHFKVLALAIYVLFWRIYVLIACRHLKGYDMASKYHPSPRFKAAGRPSSS